MPRQILTGVILPGYVFSLRCQITDGAYSLGIIVYEGIGGLEYRFWRYMVPKYYYHFKYDNIVIENFVMGPKKI